MEREFSELNYDEIPENLLGFNHHHFKELNIVGFEGEPMETSVVWFIMERATALERVSISCTSFAEQEKGRIQILKGFI